MGATPVHPRRPAGLVAALAVAVVLVGAGCVAPPPVDSPLEGTSWVLVSFGVSGEPMPPGATVTATFSQGRVTGSTGCNQYVGTVLTSAASTGFAVRSIGMTRRACAPDAMAVEQEYVQRLGRANYRDLRGDVLNLAWVGGGIVRPTIPPALLSYRRV